MKDRFVDRQAAGLHVMMLEPYDAALIFQACMQFWIVILARQHASQAARRLWRWWSAWECRAGDARPEIPALLLKDCAACVRVCIHRGLALSS